MNTSQTKFNTDPIIPPINVLIAHHTTGTVLKLWGSDIKGSIATLQKLTNCLKDICTHTQTYTHTHAIKE